MTTKGYTLKCSVCGAEKKTNYKSYKKLEAANQIDSYVCRECKKKKKEE